MIIGLTGKNAGGKGEVANYFKTKYFIYYSLSDIIREEATKRGLEHSRDNLIKIGNELREKFAPNYLGGFSPMWVKNDPYHNLEKFRNGFLA